MTNEDLAAATFGLPARWWFHSDDSMARCRQALHDAHPDNGGTVERFTLLSAAWATLEPVLRQTSRNHQLHDDYYWAWNKIDKEVSLVIGIPWPCDRDKAKAIYLREIETAHPDLIFCLDAAWESLTHFYDIESVILEECPEYAY